METVEVPPVRYSVGQEDYSPVIGAKLRISVDGISQKAVVEYDCEAGTCLVEVLDENDRPQLNETKDEVLRELLKGEVTVEWLD